MVIPDLQTRDRVSRKEWRGLCSIRVNVTRCPEVRSASHDQVTIVEGKLQRALYKVSSQYMTLSP